MAFPADLPIVEMAMIRPVLLLLSVCILISGCDKLADSSARLDKSVSAGASKVAVIDIDAVAKALGRDEVVKQQIQAAGQQLRQQLTEFSSGLQTKLNEEKSKLGSEPSADERQQLQEKLLAAQQQVQQSQVLARQKAAQFQNQLALQFRNEMRPVAAEIARKQGASTVLLANTLLWFDAPIDITGAVIDAMSAKGAATAAPAVAPAAPAEQKPATK